MLQQTQVATVLSGSYFERFLTRFPDLESLAVADDDMLLKAWEGLGYYRRVRQLREAARTIIRDHAGQFPHEMEDLLSLPGVGRYTAGAIRAFAFDLPSVLVDGNIARVLARLENIRLAVDSRDGQTALWNAAGALACAEQPRIHHSGLMELGQRICRPGLPDCLACPVATWCLTRNPEKLPVKKAKVSLTSVEEHALYARDARNRILLHREQGSRRQGLWKLPVRPLVELEGLPVIDSEKYTITRYKVITHVHAAGHATCKQSSIEGESWIPVKMVPSLAMSAPYRRVICRLLGFEDESV